MQLFFLVFGVGLNLLLLMYFKYAFFILENLKWLFSIELGFIQLILPLGISFFTFQQITYLVDTYKGITKNNSFYDYALFVLFFPQLIAGPIVHHAQMLSQFSKPETFIFKWKNFALGISIFVFGLSKKMLIADPLSENVGLIYANLSNLSSLDAWLGVISYSMQIYFDFSGYSDMAIGLAFLFGIRLPINFNSPYKAENIIDFWRRWHITLSTFLKDYIYIPLGGSRCGTVRRLVNLMVTMLLGGLWHGAGWAFVIWGALHGFYLIINHLYRKLNIESNHYFYKSGCRLVTFLAVAVAWVFFRSTSLDEAMQIFQMMFFIGEGNQVYIFLFESKAILTLVSICFVAFFMPNTQEIFGIEKERKGVLKRVWAPANNWAWAISLLLLICTFSVSKASEFLYYQF